MLLYFVTWTEKRRYPSPCFISLAIAALYKGFSVSIKKMGNHFQLSSLQNCPFLQRKNNCWCKRLQRQSKHYISMIHSWKKNTNTCFVKIRTNIYLKTTNPKESTDVSFQISRFVWSMIAMKNVQVNKIFSHALYIQDGQKLYFPLLYRHIKAQTHRYNHTFIVDKHTHTLIHN